MNTSADIYNLPEVRGVYKFAEPLKNYTWLNVGGPAEVMYFPEDEEDLRNFMRQKSENLPVFVIGGGSNLLVRDGGISGVVIKLRSQNFTKQRIENNTLYCGAGSVNFSLRKVIEKDGLGGLEFLCSIPGTIGGAVQGNAGCFGSDMATVLTVARVMLPNGEVRNLSNEECGFSYRHSDIPADWIILEVGLKFTYERSEDVAAKIAQNAEYRRTHQPQGIRTAGSTFKNPEGYAAWKLIKQCGGDKMVCGGARMSEQHCNFLHNDGTATAADIEKLCHAIEREAATRCGVPLELEIKIVGRE